MDEDLNPSSSHQQYVNFDDYKPENDSNPRAHLFSLEFYRHPKAIENAVEIIFHVKKHNTTIGKELYLGVIQFISCLYVLPVIPVQLSLAGYSKTETVVVTAAACGIGCILAGFLSNLPFIVAPSTSVAIFFAVSLKEDNLHIVHGNLAVIISGIFLMLLGYRPLSKFMTGIIPRPIQVGTAVGVGLITALAGSTEVDLVVSGKYTILDMGDITSEVELTLFGVVLAAIGISHHVQGTFSLVLLVNMFLWWMSQGEWPRVIAGDPKTISDLDGSVVNAETMYLVISILFVYIMFLNGLIESFTDMASLHKSLPGDTKSKFPSRARWIFIVCGFVSVISGLLSGPPILLSPESVAGIKAGAKTGLSTVVCGILFCVSVFFAPFFATVPDCATAPILIIIGVLLFQNTKKIDWHVMEEAVPAFCVLFFIPFTYSILQGVSIGFVIYIITAIFSKKSLVTWKKVYYGDHGSTFFQTLLEWMLFIFYNGNENPVSLSTSGISCEGNKETEQKVITDGSDGTTSTSVANGYAPPEASSTNPFST